ncbi:MAG TPA: sigma 54-interacting transcriptional regulator [Gemmatimonadales bacterium]|nr:sigma 54-interacting transcriptional regulator [Gemmatimonadales bacterium]
MTDAFEATLVGANGCPPIIGVSDALRRAVHLAQRFAQTDLPILILGPTGTGKELLAQHIHHWSGRRGSLVDVNCAGLPRDLVDGWLFGHRKNAFTGAGEAAVGLVEAAACGTLFLDEICSLPWEAQAKLLRVLETKEVRRVMEVGKRPVSFGVVAAAQDDLETAIRRGAFRRDLYQRLAGAILRLPPLKERPQDILPLAAHYAGLVGRRLDTGSTEVLQRYLWPGNVRELGATVRRATLLDDGPLITAAALAESIALGALTPAGDHRAARSRWDDERIRAETIAALEAARWVTGKAARKLGIHRTTLFRRARRLGIPMPEKRT